MAQQIQFRRDTAANWTSANPLLAQGEMGIELDTHLFKIGDGVNAWNSLPYGGMQGAGLPVGGSTGQALVKTSNSDLQTGWATVDKSYVGLGNVDNTSDVNKPISTATQSALNTLTSEVTGKQDASNNLTALSGVSSSGFLSKTGSSSAAARTIQTGAGLSITDGDGVAGDPTISMSNMAAQTLKGNASGNSSAPADLTVYQVNGMLPQFTPTVQGVVPASGGGSVNYLRSDGVWAPPSGSGLGSVTSVSVVSVNGVSGTVSNPTTTPAISLSLGDITPHSITATSSITAGGSIFGSNFSGSSSGTNTGDQTITLTGDVSGTGTGSFSTTIAAGSVTNAKLAGSISASKLVGTDIATVGTITSGTWNGTGIDIAHGGTGASTANGALTNLLPSQTSNAGKFLQTNGTLTSWVAGNSGTVTNVSSSSSQGVTVSVTNPSSTPNIAVGLGAITPTSVSATGAVTGSNLSGTNTGDQTIVLSGDITGTGQTTFATTLTDGAVTTSKLAGSIPASKLLGTDIATVGTITAGTWNGTAVGVAFGGTGATTANGALANLLPSQATNSGKFLQTDGTTTSWVAGNTGTVSTVSVVTANGISGSVANSTTTPAITLSLGSITPTSVAATGTVTGSNLSGTNTGDQTITLTGDVAGGGSGTFATTISANSVTNAKMATMASNTFKGNSSVSSANPSDLTAAQATAMLTQFSSTAQGVVPLSGGGTNKYLRADSTWTSAITPASVAATGTVTGSNLSGTNTGDQTITLSGAVTGTGTGSFATTLSPGVVYDANVATGASIAYGKLNLSGSIQNGDISPTAAIAYSKLNLGTSIQNSDISPTAAIAYSKLSLGTSIQNSDISPTAAIAYSKLNLGTSIQNSDISPTAAIAYSKLNLGTSIQDSDVSPTASISLSKLGLLTAISEMYGFPSVGDTLLAAFSRLAYSGTLQQDKINQSLVVQTGTTWIRANTILAGTASITLQLGSTLRLI